MDTSRYVVFLLICIGAYCNAFGNGPNVNGWLDVHSCNQDAQPLVRGDNIISTVTPGKLSVVTMDSQFHAVFVRSSQELGNQLLWKLQQRSASASWSDWSVIGSPGNNGLWSDPVAVQTTAVNGQSFLRVFALGSDGNLYRIQQNASSPMVFSDWKQVGPSMPSVPANETGSTLTVVHGYNGLLNAFVKAGQTVQYISENTFEEWSKQWTVLGGTHVELQSDLSVALNSYTQKLEAFAVMKDGKLYHTWQWLRSEEWAQWEPLWRFFEPEFTSNPEVHSMSGSLFEGMLEVFVRGSKNQIWHVWQTTCDDVNNPWSPCTWGAYYEIGKNTPANIDDMISLNVGSNIHGGLEVFITGEDGNLWKVWQTEMWGSWSDWQSLGQPQQPLSGPPTVAQTYAGWWNAYVRGQNGDLEIYIQETSFAVLPQVVSSGSPIEVHWFVPVDECSSSDWIGLYQLSANNSEYLDFLYIGGKQNPTEAITQGNLTFHTLLPDGVYEFRYLVNKSTKDVMRSVVQVTNSTVMNPVQAMFIGIAYGIGEEDTNFVHCISDVDQVYQYFDDAFIAFEANQPYKGLANLGEGIQFFGKALGACSQTDIAKAIIKFSEDIADCAGGDCEGIIVDTTKEVLLIVFEDRHELFGDIQAAMNSWKAKDYAEAGINIGKVIQVVVSPAE